MTFKEALDQIFEATGCSCSVEVSQWKHFHEHYTPASERIWYTGPEFKVTTHKGECELFIGKSLEEAVGRCLAFHQASNIEPTKVIELEKLIPLEETKETNK